MNNEPKDVESKTKPAHWSSKSAEGTHLAPDFASAENVQSTQDTKWSETENPSVVSDSLRPQGLYSPWNSPGQNTGVDSLSFLQGIFPTQGSNPSLLHSRLILHQLTHKGSPGYKEDQKGHSWGIHIIFLLKHARLHFPLT